MKVWMILPFLLIALVAVGCAKDSGSSEEPSETAPKSGYTQISQEEAKEMMKKDDGHVVVDVRTEEEYVEGHIPGAILVPNESIGVNQLEKLSDYDQIILIYCRSGNRSKKAAEKLVEQGYKNIYEFGGIIDWTGDIVEGKEDTELKEEVKLVFDSFDGGGPSYVETIEDESIVSCDRRKVYHNADHEDMEGSAFDYVFTFKGIKAGETSMIIEEKSIMTDEVFEHKYKIMVDESLMVSVEEVEE